MKVFPRKGFFLLVLSMTLVFISTLFSSTTLAASNRLSGDDRFRTAVAISQEGWEDGAKNVVVARGDLFPDALAGTPLAAAKDAPILLTFQDELPSSSLKEIQRLQPENVYILGGPAAIDKEVESSIKNATKSIKNVIRISGNDRYDTSVKIAKELGMTKKQVIIATGENFPDALSVASYAAQHSYPIVLTKPDELPSVVDKYLKDVKGLEKVYVIGGEAAISNDTIKNISKAERIAGNSRYDTSLKIVRTLFNTNETIYVSTGKNFADALTGSVLAGKNNTGILLVDEDNFKNQQISKLIRENFIQNYVILGGEAAVPVSVEKRFANLFEQNQVELGSLQFFIEDANTNKKLDNVKITAAINDKTFHETEILSSGEYKITLPEGEYQLTFNKSGYVTETFNITVKKEQTTYLPVIQLTSQSKTGSSTVMGTIIDGLTQEPIEQANIVVRKGYNALSGNVVKSTFTDKEGAFSLTLPAGAYTLEVIKNGYVPYRYYVVSKAGQTISNQNGTLLPNGADGKVRMVLSWGSEPKDLDIHVTGLTANNQKFHVYWDQPEYKQNNNLLASLDSPDAREGLGPEVLTIHEPTKGKYKISVYNYSYRLHNNSSSLTHSEAKVDVYVGNQLTSTYYVPQQQQGKIWDVIQLENGKVTENHSIHDGNTVSPQTNLQLNIQSSQKVKEPLENE